MKTNWLTRLALVVFWFYGSSSMGQERLGHLLEIAETRDGRLQAMGAYETTGESYVWHLQFQSRLSQESIGQFPQEMHFNFWHRLNQAYIGPWRPMERHLLRHGHFFEHSPRTLYQLLPDMPEIVMVFAIRGFGDFEPVYHLPMAELCGIRSLDYFTNLSDPEQNCADVEVTDLPNSPTACLALREKFDLWRQRGYITCARAREQDLFKGCDLAVGVPYQCE